MKAHLLAVAVVLLGAVNARAETFPEIAQFAQQICGDIPSGNLTRTNIKGKVQANVGVLGKIVGGTADVDASRGQVIYDGIPWHKLPDSIPTVSMCKLELVKIILINQYKPLQPPVKEDSSARSKKISILDYKGPPFWVTPQEIARDYPAGSWSDMGGGSRKFSYKTKFEGSVATLEFFLPSDSIEFEHVLFQIYRYYGSGIVNEYSATSQEVSELCGSVYDSILSQLIEGVGPIVDKPLVRQNSQSSPDGCLQDSCWQVANIVYSEVKFKKKGISLSKERHDISNRIASGGPFVPDSGGCMVRINVDNPNLLRQ